MNLPSVSNTTAFYAGAWAGIVAWFYLYFETTPNSVQTSNYAFLIACALCIVPAYPFVFGPRRFYKGPFRTQIKERFTDFGAMLRRCLFWVLGAAIVMLPYAYIKFWTDGAF